MDRRIPWYYMWTPNYEIFHRLIQESFDRFPILHSDFCDRPMYFEQALFNQKLTISSEPGIHAFSNSNAKVDLMIQCIEQNWGKYFIFSDADIYINSGKVKEMCAPFMELGLDCVFMKENNTEYDVNIGFVLTKANDLTLALWKDIRQRILNEGGHDQSIMCALLKNWAGNWSTFDAKDITCNKTYSDYNFIIFQFLSSCNGYESDMAEKLYTLSKIYDIDYHLYLVNEAIIDNMKINRAAGK
jgi:hypothetical protein